MGILKSKKNKKFSYSPRYYDDKGQGNPYSIENRFDKYRQATGNTKGIVNKAKMAWADLKEAGDKDTNKRLVIIIAVLVLLFLFIIDFDLSIFLTR